MAVAEEKAGDALSVIALVTGVAATARLPLPAPSKTAVTGERHGEHHGRASITAVVRSSLDRGASRVLAALVASVRCLPRSRW